ncbi:unnamed protein product, partial [Mesorhabditis spiculigera]
MTKSMIQTCVPLVTLLPTVLNFILLTQPEFPSRDAITMAAMLCMSFYGNLTVLTTFAIYKPYRVYLQRVVFGRTMRRDTIIFMESKINI